MAERTAGDDDRGVFEIRPQPRQAIFLSHPADVVIFGGAAGGGKTHALLIEPIRHLKNPEFKAVIFRRTCPLILKPGGIWDDSKKLYPAIGGEPLLNPPRWTFPSGATISFQHLTNDETVYEYKSAQIPLIMWDQLEEFSEAQWWYLFSRNRSTCGIHPYVRATCNPDADSWLASFLAWWIDQDTGYPIQERAGKTRWMARDGDTVVWGNTREDVIRKTRPDALPKSVSFVPSLLDDNPALLKKDPGYRANIQMLTTVERERLEKGNWKIRPKAGLVFPRDRWKFCEVAPADTRWCRYWDKAATEGGTGARTAGVRVGISGSGPTAKFFIGDAVAGRWGDLEREDVIKATAESDRARFGWRVATSMEEEGGSGGSDSAKATVRNLAGHVVKSHRKRTAKHLAWKPLAAQQQAGNVAIVTGISDAGAVGDQRAVWDFSDFIRELDALSGDPDQDKKKLKDLADAASGAFNELTNGDAGYGRELICSGEYDEVDPQGYNRRAPLTEAELTELPEDIASVVRDLRTADPRSGLGRDWDE